MKICVFVCDDSQAWKPKDFGDMFIDCLTSHSQEKWEFCKCLCAAGEPISEHLDADAFIISGSRFNVRDGVAGKLEWFQPMCRLIREVAKDPHSTKRIVGCCFGHQVIAHALGGKVDKNPSDNGEFILLAETLQWDEKALCSTLKEKCKCDNSVKVLLNEEFQTKVICSHGDSVTERPQNSILLASSCSCENEVIVYGSGYNIMSCQGHPEFEYEYAMRDRIWKAVVEKNKRLSESKIETAKESFRGFDRTRGPDQLSHLIAEFLHGTRGEY